MADESPAANTPPAENNWQTRAEAAERELALRRALGTVDWIDADDALRELTPLAERGSDGQWRVRNGGDPSAAPVDPADAVRALAAKKPHWVRARVIAGSGAGGGDGSGTAVTYAELLRPENEHRLRQYIHDRPEELERLRQAHHARR